jgi:ribosomal RNA assembly protein
MAEYVKIPKDRVGAVIGKEGKSKAMLEKRCSVKLDVSKEGAVSIVSPQEDGLKEWKALEIVKAIARGFNPKFAVLLLKEDYVLSIINLYDILKHKDNEVRRIKARIIGEEGKSRETIETLTNTKISVYGRTASVIGVEGDVALVEKAVQMFIDGARHTSVYKILEQERSKRRIGL